MARDVMQDLISNRDLSILNISELSSMDALADAYLSKRNVTTLQAQHHLFAAFQRRQDGVMAVSTFQWSNIAGIVTSMAALQFDTAVKALTALQLQNASQPQSTNITRTPPSITFKPSQTVKKQHQAITNTFKLPIDILIFTFLCVTAFRVVEERKRGLVQLYGHWKVLTSAQLLSHILSLGALALSSTMLMAAVMYSSRDAVLLASKLSFLQLCLVLGAHVASIIVYGVLLGTLFNSGFAVILQAFLLNIQDPFLDMLMALEFWRKVPELEQKLRMVLPILNFKRFQILIDQPHADPVKEVGDLVRAALVSCFVFWILAWYISQCFPKKQLPKQPLWFIFLPSYWMSSNLHQHSKITTEAGIQLKNVSKVYYKQRVLDNVTFEAHTGHLYSILGRNGAGKSTLMKLLSGKITPSTGSVHLFGNDIKFASNMINVLTQISYCAQDNFHWKDLTIYEHVKIFAALSNSIELSGASKEKVSVFLDELGLCEVMDKKVGHLSGGMKRRFNLALSSMRKCKLILLDEPTSGVDRVTMKKIWTFIAKLKRDALVLLATHSMEEAEALSDDILFLNKGNVVLRGSPQLIRDSCATEYELSLRVSDALQEHIKGLLDAYFGTDVQTKLMFGGNMRVQFKKEHLDGVLQLLEGLKSDHEVTWRIKSSSLEDIFCTVCPEERKEEEKQIEDFAECNPPGADSYPRPASSSWAYLFNQARGIITKNIQLTRRKPSIIIILIVMLLLLGSNISFTSLPMSFFKSGKLDTVKQAINTSLSNTLGESKRPFVLCNPNNGSDLVMDKTLAKAFERCRDESPQKAFEFANDWMQLVFDHQTSEKEGQVPVFHLDLLDTQFLNVSMYFDPNEDLNPIYSNSLFVLNGYLNNTGHVPALGGSPVSFSQLEFLDMYKFIIFSLLKDTLLLGFIPVCGYHILREKKKGLWDALRLQGMPYSAYFLGNYFFHLAVGTLYVLAIVLVCTVIGRALSFEPFPMIIFFLGSLGVVNVLIAVVYAASLCLNSFAGSACKFVGPFDKPRCQ
jgi:ABC-2 type transport system ATP-binding protein